MTLTNVTLGWWGTISLILTPVFTINNVARYLGAIGLASPPPDARPPELTNDVVGVAMRYALDVTRHVLDQGARTAIRTFREARSEDTP